MNGNGDSIKTGVYICHCGTNIAGTVNIADVIKFVEKLDNVHVTKDYKYMCSEPGQELIKNDIRNEHLSRIVVASCSPLLHEHTFRGACAQAGLNPYLFQMANIREHCSWVTEDGRQATEKAKRIINAAVRRVAEQVPLERKTVSVNPNVLVVGGGIAGIEAALRLAGAGRNVFLVEKEPSIGGHMAEIDKTFPTLDCAACILTPKMSEVAREKRIKLMSFSEVDHISGFVGNFKAKIHKKARFVDADRCTGCGVCWSNCPMMLFPKNRVIKKGKVQISPEASA